MSVSPEAVVAASRERVLTGVRWSSAVICPRRAVYEGLGVEGEPWSPQMLSIFRRGRFIGAAIAADIEADLIEQGRPAGVAEREVPWPAADPIGVGHADYLIVDERRIIEVVSSVGCELPRHKALQGAGYAINDPDADEATVLSIDPSSYVEKPYPLDIDGLIDDVLEIEQVVVNGIRTGEIPRRAMRPNGYDEVEGPNEHPCFECPFKRRCWSTWEPWPSVELPESMIPKLERLAALEDYLATRKKEKEPEADAERKALRAQVRARMMPGVRYSAGGIRVHFVEVAATRRFSLADAEKAGHTLPESLQAFITESGAHERWTVRRTDEEASDG